MEWNWNINGRECDDWVVAERTWSLWIYVILLSLPSWNGVWLYRLEWLKIMLSLQYSPLHLLREDVLDYCSGQMFDLLDLCLHSCLQTCRALNSQLIHLRQAVCRIIPFRPLCELLVEHQFESLALEIDGRRLVQTLWEVEMLDGQFRSGRFIDTYLVWALTDRLRLYGRTRLALYVDVLFIFYVDIFRIHVSYVTNKWAIWLFIGLAIQSASLTLHVQ